MKKLLRPILIFLVWFVICYVAIAFYFLTLNPFKWLSEARGFFSFTGILGGFIAAVLFGTQEYDNKKNQS